MITELTDLLSSKFGNNIKITFFRSGNRKNVYIAEIPQNKFVVLVDTQKSISQQYCSLRSNYMQKFLFQSGLDVADVLYLSATKDDLIVACHTYIDGYKILKMNEDSAFQIGRAIAKLHLLSTDKEFIQPKYPLKYELYNVIKSELSLLQKLKSSLTDKSWHGLPCGICHFDLNLSNFIFSNDKIFMIDFDRFRYWPFVYELKHFINTDSNCLFATQIIEGYNSVRPLTLDEHDILY